MKNRRKSGYIGQNDKNSIWLHCLNFMNCDTVGYADLGVPHLTIGTIYSVGEAIGLPHNDNDGIDGKTVCTISILWNLIKCHRRAGCPHPAVPQ